jgi:hypothetical protein
METVSGASWSLAPVEGVGGFAARLKAWVGSATTLLEIGEIIGERPSLAVNYLSAQRGKK